MRGLMQQRQLRISSDIDHAAQVFGEAEIVSRTIERAVHCYAYREQLSDRIPGLATGEN